MLFLVSGDVSCPSVPAGAVPGFIEEQWSIKMDPGSPALLQQASHRTSQHHQHLISACCTGCQLMYSMLISSAKPVPVFISFPGTWKAQSSRAQPLSNSAHDLKLTKALREQQLGVQDAGGAELL